MGCSGGAISREHLVDPILDPRYAGSNMEVKSGEYCEARPIFVRLSIHCFDRDI